MYHKHLPIQPSLLLHLFFTLIRQYHISSCRFFLSLPKCPTVENIHVSLILLIYIDTHISQTAISYLFFRFCLFLPIVISSIVINFFKLRNLYLFLTKNIMTKKTHATNLFGARGDGERIFRVKLLLSLLLILFD